MMRNKIIYLFSLVLLFSCEKEIEYKGEGKEPLLVLDAILETNEPPLIYLTRSVFFLSNNTNSADIGVSGAVVKLTNVTDGIEYILTSNSNPGFYAGNTNIKENTVYKIEISHPSYTSISSEMTTVSTVDLIDFDTSSLKDNYLKKYLTTFKFVDPIETNFYSANLYASKKITSYDYNGVLMSIDTVGILEYGSVEDASVGFYHGGSVFFNDLLFNNKLKNMQFEVSEYDYGFQVIEYLSKSVTLVNMTEGVFKYFKSIGNNQPNGPFNDPTNVYTNVKNGLGIFGCVATSQLTK